MGFKEAKEMLIIMGTILIITNIFSGNMTELGNLQGVSGAVVDDVYDIDPSSTQAGRLTGDGEKLDEWINKTDSSDFDDSTSYLDFAFQSWEWVKNAVKMMFKFTYAPYDLVNQWVKTDNMEAINWLPTLIGFIWTIGITITFLQVIWKE